jgi:hypothetical protein
MIVEGGRSWNVRRKTCLVRIWRQLPCEHPECNGAKCLDLEIRCNNCAPLSIAVCVPGLAGQLKDGLRTMLLRNPGA